MVSPYCSGRHIFDFFFFFFLLLVEPNLGDVSDRLEDCQSDFAVFVLQGVRFLHDHCTVLLGFLKSEKNQDEKLRL